MRQIPGFTTLLKRSTSTVAPQAPKISIDIKSIRANPRSSSENCVNKNYPSLKEHPFKIVDALDRRKDVVVKAQPFRKSYNALQGKMSELSNSREGLDDEVMVTERAKLKKRLGETKEGLRAFDEEARYLDELIEAHAVELPNLTSPKTPVGSGPRLLSIGNEHLMALVASERAWKDHVTLGKEFDLIDFESASITTGRGWYFLRNEAVSLQDALVVYAKDFVERHGFSKQEPPSMVHGYMAKACGFWPRDKNEEQQIYKIAQSERDKGKSELYLAATAEYPFAASKANVTFREQELPMQIVGSSRCFRAEAGARGTDTKGLYRVHEFTKVEMFTWCQEAEAASLLEKMLDIQKEILTHLGLLFQVLEMPSSDLGHSAYRKIDIEAWFPSRKARNNGWGEVTSLSNCTDYQTRRLNTRMNLANGKGLVFPFTLNGTALAVPRVLMGILEMGWDEKEDIIKIPEVLWPYMGNKKIIRKKDRSRNGG